MLKAQNIAAFWSKLPVLRNGFTFRSIGSRKRDDIDTPQTLTEYRRVRKLMREYTHDEYLRHYTELLSPKQKNVLEAQFGQSDVLTVDRKQNIARALGLSRSMVKNWWYWKEINTKGESRLLGTYKGDKLGLDRPPSLVW